MDFDALDDDASAMAAAMGFSSFGSHKPPAKKRKFNASTDAFVEGQELENIDRGGKKGKGSGGNTMPLGKMRQFGAGKKSAPGKEAPNGDEIDLDDDEDEDGGAPIEEYDPHRPAEAARPVAPRYKLSLPPPTVVPSGAHSVNGGRQNIKNVYGVNDGADELEQRKPVKDKQGFPIRHSVANGGNEDEINLGDEDEEAGPAYLDTSEAPPIEVAPTPAELEAKEMQARIDALLASIEEEPRQAVEEYSPLAPLMDPPGQPHYIQPDFTLPQGGHRGGCGGRGRGGFSDTASVASSRPSQRGERNPLWYMEYYDPSFNENPWEKLEVDRNLKPVGSWLETQDKPRRDRW